MFGGADRVEIPDLVLGAILGELPLDRILALRAASKGLVSIVARLFCKIHPKRRISLDRVLVEPGLWEIGGWQHRTLRGLRALYSGSPTGPVVVSLVAAAGAAGAAGDIMAGDSVPTYDQTAVLTDGMCGFLAPGDEVHLYFNPKGFIKSGSGYEMDLLCNFSGWIVSVSVDEGPLKIWQIEALRRHVLPPTLKRLCLEGVDVPLAEGSGGRKKADGTNAMRRMLLGVAGLTDLSLARTDLVIGPLVKALCRMRQMRHLDLGRTRIDPNEAADVISCMPGLASLTLSCIESVAPRLVSAIFSLPLTKLSLSRCGITDARVLSSAAVAAVAAGQATIETLDLSENGLTSVEQISALLDALPALREIDLRETLPDQDELVPVLVARPSVKARLSFPRLGRLADHTERHSVGSPGNILWFPLDHGA
jgi:hypothetical protein